MPYIIKSTNKAAKTPRINGTNLDIYILKELKWKI